MIEEYFKKQIESGPIDTHFFYGVEVQPAEISIRVHRESLAEFPSNLVYVRHLSDSMPLFKEAE